MTLDEFASHLTKAKSVSVKGVDGYRACCPAHDDNSPSFAAWEKDGWLHVKCQTGCSEEAILSAMGLTQEDRRVVPLVKVGAVSSAKTTYDYHGADGEVLFRKVRYLTQDGKKSFYQELPNGERGVATLNGKSKTFYRLPEVLAAVQSGATIYINEGEKACDKMRHLGFVATCQPGGADKNAQSKWLPAHTDILKGASVVVVADRDAVGETYAAYVASVLRPECKSVSIVQSATTCEKDDAYDHFTAGHKIADFICRSDLLPRRGFSRKIVESELSIDPDFLIGNHLRRGQMNLLDADGGAGKTTLALAIAAGGSVGFDPVGRRAIPTFRTLLFATEDSIGDLRHIYEKMGGLPGFLEIVDEVFSLTSEYLLKVRETIQDGDFQLVIFDALAYYMSGISKDGNNAMELVAPLAGLRQIAMDLDVCILNMRHMAKGSNLRAASEMGMGSVQYRNSHRSQLVMRMHPDKEKFRGVRIITHEKGSLRTQMGKAFGFEYRNDEFMWRHDLDESCFESEEAKAEVGKLEEAKRLLTNHLTGVYIPVGEINEMAKALGISKRTIERARTDLEVKCIKAGNNAGWLLHLEVTDPFPD